MARLLFILAILAAAIDITFAEKPTPIIVSAVAKTNQVKSIAGKVESVILADPVNAVKSKIIITDGGGQKATFSVEYTTTIYALDWKATSLEKISAGDLVRIKYVTSKEGVNQAVSINIIK